MKHNQQNFKKLLPKFIKKKKTRIKFLFLHFCRKINVFCEGNCNVNLENLFTSVYEWTSRNHKNNVCDKENCFLIRPFAELLCDIYPRCQRPHLLGILGKILNDVCTHRCEEVTKNL